MKTKFTVVGLAAVLVGLGAPLAGYAQCVGSIGPLVVADGLPRTLGISANATVIYDFIVNTGRSYSFQVTTPDPGASVFNAQLVRCEGVAGTSTDTSLADPPLFNFPNSVFSGRRLSFLPSASGIVGFNFTNPDFNNAHAFDAVLVETTLYNPGWSTGAGFNTFYSIQNTTNASCSVTLKLFNLAGTQVATTTQSVAAGGLLATNTQSLGVGVGLAGTGTLTHDCPPGGILVDAAIANFNTSPAAIIPAKFQPVRE